MKRLLSYRLSNLQGQGARDYQEDSFAFANALDVTLIKQRGLYAIVADGMGGMKDGRESSRLAVKTLLSDFEKMDREGDLSRQLDESARHACREVNGLTEGMGGCTLAAGIFYKEHLHFISVGDSYIWLLRNGELIRLNHEQNRKTEIYLECIHNNDMDPRSGREHYEASALTQFIGMDNIYETDVTRYPLPLHKKDTIVFCSDGVGGVLSEDEVISCLTGKTAETACLAMDGIIKKKNRRNQDNYTALVIQCDY